MVGTVSLLHRMVLSISPIHSSGMGADRFSATRNFLTRPPTGRYFLPALPSDCITIDFPGRAISPSEGFPILYFSMPLL